MMLVSSCRYAEMDRKKKERAERERLEEEARLKREKEGKAWIQEVSITCLQHTIYFLQSLNPFTFETSIFWCFTSKLFEKRLLHIMPDIKKQGQITFAMSPFCYRVSGKICLCQK